MVHRARPRGVAILAAPMTAVPRRLLALATAAAAATLATACSDFANPSELTKPTVLAVIADPPLVAPGAATSLSVVMAGPDGPLDPSAVQWQLIETLPGVAPIGTLTADGVTATYQAPEQLPELPDGSPPLDSVQATITAGDTSVVVVKGVLNARDAEGAAALGADAIVISNHGGRQLDCAPSTITVLPEIVAAVGSKLDVLIDGGFRRGAQVVKAMALGAKGVLLGRAYAYALGAGGEAMVSNMLEFVTAEIDCTIGHMGVTSFSQLGPHASQYLRQR